MALPGDQRYRAVDTHSPTSSRIGINTLASGLNTPRASFLVRIITVWLVWASNIYGTLLRTGEHSLLNQVVLGKSDTKPTFQFSLSPDPNQWDTIVEPNTKEADDYLHNPDPRRDRSYDRRFVVSWRGLANLGCLITLISALLALFAGYPIATYYTSKKLSNNGGYNLGGINATGQIPDIGNFGLIDQDTPADAYTLISYTDGSTEYELVFSDEFNQDGRTFYEGDDPFWQAVDLHYWQTGDLEWHSPEAVTTKDGALQITLSEKDAASNHNLDYQGGMLSTWNKFCFTGGIFLASVRIAGSNNVVGLWPGRAGYGATLEGLWPYSYDSCDVGTVANQSLNGVPSAATDGTGDEYNDYALSYLNGQRLSRCTCSGESHPGPMHSDGTYVGRSAPEIDVFEAQVSDNIGRVSQSGQWAPFDYQYEWHNSSDDFIIYNSSITAANSYKGGAYQESTSAVSETVQDCYQLNGTCYSTYGVEYSPGYSSDNGFITWINDDTAAWTLKAAGLASDDDVEISARPISQEPMYLITNLAISENFGGIDYDGLEFPAIMSIDWVRVYQKKGATNVGCDPDDFPTAAYISEYAEAYTNPNYTTWAEYGQSFPKNSFKGEC